jgi:hypothetical protein
MPDCMAAKIRFGGAMTRTALEAVLTALDLDGVAVGAVDGARARVATHDVIDIEEDDRAWGTFPETEATLIEHGIPFERHSDAKYEHSATIRVFDGSTFRETECSSAFDPFATLAQIRAAIESMTISALIDDLAFFDLQIQPAVIEENA